MALIERRLRDDKAEDVVAIDLTGKTALADGMVIATGTSQRHLAAMADKLVRDLKDAGYGAPRVEGAGPDSAWVLVDAGDIVVHLFREETRSFYNLERLWRAPTEAERPRYAAL